MHPPAEIRLPERSIHAFKGISNDIHTANGDAVE